MTNLEKLEDLTRTQCMDGNWDHDAYMRGMANGMLLSVAVMKDETPEFLDPPAKETPLSPLVASLKADPEHAYGWHCNIAMLLQDAGVSFEAANERARGFMRMAFGVEGYEQRRGGTCSSPDTAEVPDEAKETASNVEEE